MQKIGNWRHICVDTQRMFAEDTPWHVPWMARVLPQLTEVSQRHAERTVFTRFVPPLRVQGAHGTWKDYYEKWWMMTGEHLCSPWVDGRLVSHLRQEGMQTLVIMGEKRMCVCWQLCSGQSISGFTSSS